MNPILLSVVVPVARMSGRLGNLESWVKELPNQESIEVILVHDQLDSHTGNDLREMLSRIDARAITLIEGKFESPGLARNAGKKLAKGKWIQFVDSDDIPILSESLALIKVVSGEIEAIVGEFLYFDTASSKTYQDSHTGDFNLDIALNPGIWRIIFRRELIENIDFDKSKMAEDQLFILDFKIFSRKLFNSHVMIYKYFINSSTQLTRDRKSILEIKNIIPNTYKSFLIAQLNESKYVAILLIRQTLTLLKYRKSTAVKILFIGVLLPFQISLKKYFKLLIGTYLVLANRNSRIEK